MTWAKQAMTWSVILLTVLLPVAYAESLSYDANGNLQQDGTHYFEYTDDNKLERVRSGGSGGTILEEYYYDYTGKRTKKTEYLENGSTKIIYYFGKNYVREEIDGNLVDEEVKYYHDDVMVAVDSTQDGFLFHHPNHLGSTDLVTNSSGGQEEKLRYLPFGGELTAGESRFKFTNKERDDTGLDYFEARYYSSQKRLFVQPDSILPDVYDPQQLNRYSYTRNNPVKYVDEDGHSPTLVTAAIGAGIGALIGGGVSLGVQLYHGNGINWGSVGVAAGAGAVSGAVAGLTLGIGNAAIAGAGLTGGAAVAAEGAAVVGSSVAAGAASRGTVAAVQGNSVVDAAFDPSAMAVDAVIGGATLGAGKLITSAHSGASSAATGTKTGLKVEATQRTVRIREPGNTPLMRVDYNSHHGLPQNHLQYGHNLYTGRHGDEATDILADVMIKNPKIKFPGESTK